MKKYDVLLMDLDDTLLDYRTSERESLIKVFAAFDVPYNEESYLLFRKINGQLWMDYEAGVISKAELLRKFNDIIVTEGYAMPLYLGHLLQTLPWYGLSKELESSTRQILEKMRLETEAARANTEQTYLAVQEAKHSEF